MYASLAALLVRDFSGCFRFNLTRRPAAAVWKPVGYAARTLRRPLWCPPKLLVLLCAERAQVVCACEKERAWHSRGELKKSARARRLSHLGAQ